MGFKGLFLTIFIFFSICSLSFAQGLAQPPMVRLIYFVPSDRQPQPDIDTKMDALIKSVQQFFADAMENHGFDRKTFSFEADATGKAVIHQVNGQFADMHYHHQTWEKVWGEIDQHFDTSRNIYLIALDTSQPFFQPILPDGEVGGTCGIGAYHGTTAGRALMPASGHCFTVDLAAHELGHAFGLVHDRRVNPKIIPVQYKTEVPKRTDPDRMLTSFCAAERLDVHPSFNTNHRNQNFFEQNATVEMLPPDSSPPDAIRLRFTVTDADGLHQARLLDGGAFQEMMACKTLQGKSFTVEFVTDLLTPEINEIILEVIDIKGNATQQTFPIDIVPLLSPAETVLIPDPHLAAAVRETLSLAPDSVITTHAMLDLYDLLVSNRQITDLTGLEYARNLQWLALGPGVYGSPGETVNSNRISDLSPIAGLTNLRTLWLSYCYIADISMLVSVLAELTQLVDLGLNGNAISDVSALAALTQLKSLSLSDNTISDVSALAALTQLKSLSLSDNTISDISAFSNLARMEVLHLGRNFISDVSAVANLTQMRTLSLTDNHVLDISPLSGLTLLGSLGVGGNSISDISALANLIRLRSLDLGGNSVSDISALANLTQVKDMYLWGNQIRDIAPLAKLENLTVLRLEGNPIADRTPLRTLLQENSSLDVDIGLDPPTDTNDPKIEVEDSITGPWLWMIAPTAPYQGGAASTNVDTLALVSEGRVTEAEIAKKGANEGDSVGNYRWTLAEIRNTGIGNPFNFVGEIDNVTDVVHRIGWAEGDVDHHSSYALITLESATAQENVVMRVGSDDSIKVWLNGAVVHNNPVNRGSRGFQDTFRVNLRAGNNLLLIKVSENWGNWSMFVGIEAEVTAVYKSPASTPSAAPASDVNQDGQVNVLDLILVAQHLGETILGNPRADVNGDGEVNILDLAFVASAFGEDTVPAAPAISLAQTDVQEIIPAIQTWIHLAQVEDNGSVVFRQGIDNLQRLLASLLPQKTALLPNYPNPFNPETWIPYQLAQDSAVLIRIYTANGTLVKTLQLGHQTAGIYQSRNRAAYWDGKNEIGESVASGIYFYALAAGDFNATGKMLIRK